MANAKPYLELRQHQVGVNDLFVLRVSERPSETQLDELMQAIQDVRPDWQGRLVVIGADTSLERLDDTTQRTLFDILSQRFAV
jgi:hypothetical protein